MAAFAKKSAVGLKGADGAAAGSIQNNSGLPQGPAGASGASLAAVGWHSGLGRTPLQRCNHRFFWRFLGLTPGTALLTAAWARGRLS
jgi:hypothetical protein